MNIHKCTHSIANVNWVTVDEFQLFINDEKEKKEWDAKIKIRDYMRLFCKMPNLIFKLSLGVNKCMKIWFHTLFQIHFFELEKNAQSPVHPVVGIGERFTVIGLIFWNKLITFDTNLSSGQKRQINHIQLILLISKFFFHQMMKFESPLIYRICWWIMESTSFAWSHLAFVTLIVRRIFFITALTNEKQIPTIFHDKRKMIRFCHKESTILRRFNGEVIMHSKRNVNSQSFYIVTVSIFIDFCCCWWWWKMRSTD